MPTRRGLPHDLFVTAFPFHMAFDRDMRVVQIGRVLQRLYPDLSLRKPLQKDFRINRPRIQIDFEAIRQHAQSLFILESLHNGMLLKGQMLPTESPEGVFFLCSPWLTDLESAQAFGLTIDDFAIHDPITDFLFLLQTKNVALSDINGLANKLNLQRAELQRTNEQLRQQIAERQQAEETIRHLAYHDPLTDLPNRTLFKDRLTLALAQARRNKHMLAVMFLDLDRFKLVNDTAGHPEGDALLRSVSEQLNELVREGDTVARVGGDEFTLLLPGIAGVGDAAEVAQRILETLRQPHVLAGHEFHITPSIGITIFPTDADDPEALLTNADIAMYHAKEQGRDNYQFYTPALNTSILERLVLENDLRHGLEREEFVVHYQPQVNISTGQIVGMEALLRWQHPDRGLVMPMEFIPVAEETGLIVPLGEWVLRTACAQTKAWENAGLSFLRVAVNLSARQFQQRNLAERVGQVLQETGLHPHRLQLEITESVAMQDVDYTITILRRLKEMGVQIAIDDFGTGHSALSYLRRLPIDVVKIDRSFIRDLAINPSDAEITATVIVMAHNLKLEVIAEGVETEEQLAFLKQRLCDQMQGFLFSRPVPAEELKEMLVRGDRSEAA